MILNIWITFVRAYTFDNDQVIALAQRFHNELEQVNKYPIPPFLSPPPSDLSPWA